MITNKQEYYKEIQDLSHDIWAEALHEAYDVVPDARDRIYRLTNEFVANHQWITHSHYHDQVMRYSMNKDAYLEEYGNETLGDIVRDDGLKGLQREIAYLAMVEDVTNSIYEFLAS